MEKLKKIGLESLGTKFEDFLKKSIYEIPWYQRDYSWESDNFEQLISDLDASSNENRQHFFGMIMSMESNDERKVRIIDGQQRITTTIVFLKAIRDALEDLNLIDKNVDDCNTIVDAIDSTVLQKTTFTKKMIQD